MPPGNKMKLNYRLDYTSKVCNGDATNDEQICKVNVKRS